MRLQFVRPAYRLAILLETSVMELGAMCLSTEQLDVFKFATGFIGQETQN